MMRAFLQRRCGHTRRTVGCDRTGFNEPPTSRLNKVGDRQLVASDKNMTGTSTTDIPQSDEANSHMRFPCDNLC